MARITDIQSIKNKFLDSVTNPEADTCQAMIDAVADLRTLGMDLSAAVHSVAQWGVDGGLYPQEMEPLAEESATDIVKRQAAE